MFYSLSRRCSGFFVYEIHSTHRSVRSQLQHTTTMPASFLSMQTGIWTFSSRGPLRRLGNEPFIHVGSVWPFQWLAMSFFMDGSDGMQTLNSIDLGKLCSLHHFYSKRKRSPKAIAIQTANKASNKKFESPNTRLLQRWPVVSFLLHDGWQRFSSR